MDQKPIPYTNANAYSDLTHEWKLMLRRGESGTWIFPPLAGVGYLIRQFIDDNQTLGQELYGSDGVLHMVDCVMSESIATKEEVYQQVYAAIKELLDLDLPAEVTNLQALLKYLVARRQKLLLFVRGLDMAIRARRAEPLAGINSIAQQMGAVSVVVLVHTDITDPLFTASYSRNAALIQNVTVMPRKDEAEGRSFLKYLEEAWGVTLTADQRRWIEDNLDSSLRFTKEVFRQVQKNPELTYDELFSLPSLEYKAQALLDNFLEDQREVILKTVFAEPIGDDLRHALRYLKAIRWIKEDNGRPVLAIPFIDRYIRNNEPKASSGQPLQVLSPKEEAAYNLLQESRNQVVSRDQLADAIWGDEAAERYSDWAIDQLIHRLKSKVGTLDKAASVQTVRGRGFMLAEAAAR